MKMKIAALQIDIAWENRRANFEKVSQLARQAAEQGADFLLLPEMFATGFTMNTEVSAEPLNGETTAFIRELARRNKMGVGGGLVLRRSSEKPQNCALFVDRDGEDLALYAKIHLFSYSQENEHHTPGEEPAPFRFEGIRCAGFICYDLRFPELFRAVCRDTDAVFVIASWPAVRAEHWSTLLRARAIENQLYVIGVNRVGQGDNLRYNGGTAVIDPMGAVQMETWDEEAIVWAEITPETVQNVRTVMPFLDDMK